MRMMVLAAASLAAALLGGCVSTGPGVDEDGAAFCPGGANCPSDQNYVGFIIPETMMLADAMAPAPMAAAPASASEAAPAPAAPGFARPVLCPAPSCPMGRSGLLWWTPNSGQRMCKPGEACVPNMGTRFYGILCYDVPEGRCAGVPRGRKRP